MQSIESQFIESFDPSNLLSHTQWTTNYKWILNIICMNVFIIVGEFERKKKLIRNE